jgi:hypothetical protein
MKKETKNEVSEPIQTEIKEEGKNTSYVKVILLFSVAMVILLYGLNYLLKNVL